MLKSPIPDRSGFLLRPLQNVNDDRSIPKKIKNPKIRKHGNRCHLWKAKRDFERKKVLQL